MSGWSFTLVFRTYRIYCVAFSLLAIAIAANGFRRGEHWAWWALVVGNTLTYVGATAYDQMCRACIGARIRRPNPVMNVYSSSARNPRMHTGRWRSGATPCPAALRASAHLTHSF